MAQQGAEVVKLEDPASPDPIRDYPPLADGLSVYHAALNAGKRSLAIDYRSEAGRALVLQLVKEMDVVIEQFRPGVMEAFGLGYATLKEANPRIILVSITGYGQQGPMAHLPGHDINYLSYSGLLDGLRAADGNPIMPTAQLADVAGGSMMAPQRHHHRPAAPRTHRSGPACGCGHDRSPAPPQRPAPWPKSGPQADMMPTSRANWHRTTGIAARMAGTWRSERWSPSSGNGSASWRAAPTGRHASSMPTSSH
jgi:hypothetical protein